MPRAVIVGGVRTPFVRAFEQYTRIDTIALGTAAAKGLLERYPVPWAEIGAVVWGGVILPTTSPNVGREIVIDLGLPRTIEAMTVTRACASGLQAITLAGRGHRARRVRRGHRRRLRQHQQRAAHDAAVARPQGRPGGAEQEVDGRRLARRRAQVVRAP
jgi:hypothetical protein